MLEALCAGGFVTVLPMIMSHAVVIEKSKEILILVTSAKTSENSLGTAKVGDYCRFPLLELLNFRPI
jgi:hypothetical protein